MKEMKLGFISFALLGTSCTESDINLRDGALIYEHNYPYAQDFLRYEYSANDRLENIFFISGISDKKIISFEYSDTQQDKVVKVYYDNGDSPTITYDSLIFNGDRLTEIVNKSINGDSLLSTSVNTFDYNNQGQLIKLTSKWNEHPSNCITEVEFSDYINNQFTRVDYKWCSELELITRFEYDKNESPFKLMDKNIKLILLAHFGGTAYNFITESNIIKMNIKVHNQPTVFKHSYEINYQFDLSAQPKSSTITEVNSPYTKWTNFYKYK